jgi:hypothetical protein
LQEQTAEFFGGGEGVETGAGACVHSLCSTSTCVWVQARLCRSRRCGARSCSPAKCGHAGVKRRRRGRAAWARGASARRQRSAPALGASARLECRVIRAKMRQPCARGWGGPQLVRLQTRGGLVPAAGTQITIKAAQPIGAAAGRCRPQKGHKETRAPTCRQRRGPLLSTPVPTSLSVRRRQLRLHTHATAGSPFQRTLICE